MDHLLLPETPLRPTKFDVAFVSNEYDHGDFNTYGQRRGFKDLHELLQLNSVDSHSFLALIQTWLYFGLLSVFFGPQTPVRDFVNAQELISTKKLAEYCNDWIRRKLENNAPTTRTHVNQVRKDLRFAAQLCHGIDESLDQASSQMAGKVIFAVKILIETLDLCVKGLADRLQEREDIRAHRHDREPFSMKYKAITVEPSLHLLEVLRSQGWCQYRLAAVSFGLSSKALYFLSAFPSTALIGHGHNHCTRQSCVNDNLPEYEPQHSPRCSLRECPITRTPMAKLKEIYNQNDVPILSCLLQQDGNLTLDIIPSSECKGFIAISHVWSDGLGNHQETGLHHCQLVELVQKVKKIQPLQYNRDSSQMMTPESSHQIFFWLDSMCIPTATAYQETRDKAIGRIDWTFAKADTVLILDRSLQNITPSSTSPLELVTHLHCSKWLSRCWTLAEGSQAWSWCIQFQDCALNLKDLKKLLFQHAVSTPVEETSFHPRAVEATFEPTPLEAAYFETMLRADVIQDLFAVYEKIPEPHKARPSFSRSWNSVLHRSTSKPGDVAGILGLVNGISIKDLVGIDHEERLKAVLNVFKTIPASMLFNRGPKVTNEPLNKWVPASVHSGSKADPEYQINTHTEGRFVGPLDTKYQIYEFRGLEGTELLLKDVQHEQLLRIRLDSRIESYQPDQRLCLVLPPRHRGADFLTRDSCIAFCATIRRQREHITLATWQSLAHVLFHQTETEFLGLPKVDTSRFPDGSELYIECDMTGWPRPEPLRPFLSDDQRHALEDFMTSFMGRCFGLCLLALMISLFLLGIAIDAPMNWRKRVALVLLAVIVLIPWLVFVAYVERRRLFATGQDPHEKWAEMFLDAEFRTHNSIIYRYLQWLRKLPNSRKPRRLDAIHLESLSTVENHEHFPTRKPSISSFIPYTNDALRSIQFLLCFIELGLTVQVYSSRETQSVATVWLMVAVSSITLLFSPLIWLSSNGYSSYRARKSAKSWISFEVLLLFLWFSGFMAFFFDHHLGSAPSMPRTVKAAAGIAGLEWVFMSFSLAERSFNYLKNRTWTKSPLTLDDLFEDPEYLHHVHAATNSRYDDDERHWTLVLIYTVGYMVARFLRSRKIRR